MSKRPYINEIICPAETQWREFKSPQDFFCPAVIGGIPLISAGLLFFGHKKSKKKSDKY